MKRSRTDQFGRSVASPHPKYFASAQSAVNSNDDSHTFDDPDRARSCLRGLESLLEDRILCDVTIVVEDKEFPCHRIVLAASSQYFSAMFQHDFVERTSNKITLNQVSPESFGAVLHYLYDGRVKLNSSNVQGIFIASHMFQIPSLESMCASYMESRVSPQNCINVYFFASAYKQSKLLQAARKMVGDNFLQIVQSEEFLQLPAYNASEILSLTVAAVKEEEVYQAALAWLRRGNRQMHVYDIMKSVRYSLMDERIFRQRVKNNPMFRDSPQLQGIFEQMLYLLNHPNRWHEVDLPVEPRLGTFRAPTMRCIVYSSWHQLHCYAPQPELVHILEQVYYKSHPVFLSLPNDVTEQPVLGTRGLQHMYIVGGGNSGKVSKKTYRFEGKLLSSCIKLSSMTSGRSLFCLVQVDRFLYAVGGYQKGQNIEAVEKFDPDKDQWTRVASLPFKLRCMAATSMRGKLYVFGGEVQQKRRGRREQRELSNKTLCYDPETDKWQMLHPMKTSRAAMGCGISHNKIYVVGGIYSVTEDWVKKLTPEGALTSCEVYDPVTDSWQDGPSLPVALYSMGVAKHEGTLYVLGGTTVLTKSGNEMRTCQVYCLNEAGTKWLESGNSLSRPPQKFASYTPLTFEYKQLNLDNKLSIFTDSDSEESEVGLWHSRTPHRDLSNIHLSSSTDSTDESEAF